MDKATEGVSEWPRQDANLLADLEIVIRANESGILSDHQRFDDATWNRHRLFGAHDQRRDAEGAVHGTPAVFRKIKNKKNIAGKQRCQNVAQFACVPNRASYSRSKTAEPKSIEVELRAILAIGMHAGHKPTFPSLQTQSRGNGSKLCARILFNCNAIQHQFLLNDAQSIVWVAVYFVGAIVQFRVLKHSSTRKVWPFEFGRYSVDHQRNPLRIIGI